MSIATCITSTLLRPLGLCDTNNLEEGLRGNLCYIVPLPQVILHTCVLCFVPTRTVSHSQTFLHVHIQSVLCFIPTRIVSHSQTFTFSVYLHQLIMWGGGGPNLVHTYVYTEAESYRLQAYMWEGLCVSLCVIYCRWCSRVRRGQSHTH